MASCYRPSKPVIIVYIAFLLICFISRYYPASVSRLHWSAKPGTFSSSSLSNSAANSDGNAKQEIHENAHRLPNADAFLPHFRAVTKMADVTVAEANATCKWVEPTKVNFQWAADNEWIQHDPPEEEVNLRRSQWHEFIDNQLMPYASYKDRFQGRGIVIVAGNEKTLTRTRVILRALTKLGSKLPVELHYWDDEMTEKSKQELIETYPAVSFNDLAKPSNIFKVKWVTTGNYQFKTAAVLNSRFAEPLLLDSDNVPIIDPESLYESSVYKEYGTLFWPDITRTRPNNPAWAITNTHCRMNEYEQESGQLLVDKRKFFYHLQLSAWLNNEHGAYYNEILLGDKDMFRFAWHALKTKYGFPRKWLTSVGTLHEGNYCGHSFAQHHPDGRVAFMHGGLLKTYAKELMSWYRQEQGGVYQAYQRSQYDEQHEVSVEIRFFFDGNAWLPGRPSDMKAAWCLGLFEVPARPLEEIAPGYQKMFNESGGYWMLDR